MTCDQKIQLGAIPGQLRLVSYTDPETGQEYEFVTNAHHLEAKIVAALYKERWKKITFQVDQTTLKNQNLAWHLS